MDDLVRPLPDVRVSPALAAEQSLIEGLLQFYLYDFSEMEPVDSDAFDFDERGGYLPRSLPADYWTDPDQRALLIRSGAKIAGLALINCRASGQRRLTLETARARQTLACQLWVGSRHSDRRD